MLQRKLLRLFVRGKSFLLLPPCPFDLHMLRTSMCPTCPGRSLKYEYVCPTFIDLSRFSNESSGIPKEMDMGTLHDSISGKGFLERRKRSEPANKGETCYFRYFARFRRIPSPDDELSEQLLLYSHLIRILGATSLCLKGRDGFGSVLLIFI